MAFHTPLWLAAAALALGLGACSTSNSSPDADLRPSGGPVMGAQDMHCVTDGGVKTQVVNPSSCTRPDGGAAEPMDFGETMFNAAGKDDDCKYNVDFTATPIRQNENFTFTLHITRTTDSMPVTGAANVNGQQSLYIEMYLTDTHPADTGRANAAEVAPGTYTIGPAKVDASGRWTVRFHIRGDCTDLLEDSPHGHGAFYLDVP